jgi:hypothetical protein
MIVEIDDGIQMPEMKEAMNWEVASFRQMQCIEDVAMKNVPQKLVTTRWVYTIKAKEDGIKR